MKPVQPRHRVEHHMDRASHWPIRIRAVAFIQEPDTSLLGATQSTNRAAADRIRSSQYTTGQVQKGTPQTSDNLRIPLCPRNQVPRNQDLGYFFPGSL